MRSLVNMFLVKHKPFTVLLLLSTFCVTLTAVSYIRSGNITYFYLDRNLFLAWVPLLFALAWQHRLNFGKLAKWKATAMFCLWLLFFPTAPYLFTDLVHLNTRFNPAIWADTLLLFSCALAGLAIGIYSLHIVHQILLQYFKPGKAWFIISMSLMLTGYGIYLGRIQRWNSWDLFTQPFTLLTDTIYQLDNPQAIKMTIGFSALLFIIYFMFKTIINHERIKG